MLDPVAMAGHTQIRSHEPQLGSSTGRAWVHVHGTHSAAFLKAGFKSEYPVLLQNADITGGGLTLEPTMSTPRLYFFLEK